MGSFVINSIMTFILILILIIIIIVVIIIIMIITMMMIFNSSNTCIQCYDYGRGPSCRVPPQADVSFTIRCFRAQSFRLFTVLVF